MAGKKRNPENQLRKEFQGQTLPNYDELTNAMIDETTSVLTDYVRQYTGSYSDVRGQDNAIFINWDPVLREQTYQRWAWYDLYWYLEQDTHIRAISTAAKVNVASLKWRVDPYKKPNEKDASPTNKAIAEFVTQAFERMETFPQHLYDLLDAIFKGFSFSEIIWKLWDNKYWTIANLMNRTQRRIQFDAQTRRPRVRTMQDPFYGSLVPAGKYIVHRTSSTWENPFGDALDQSLYWMWLFKKMGLQFFLKHLEVGSSTVPIVQHPNSANDKLKAEALKIASQIRNGAYGRLPDNFDILWAEAKNAAQTGNMYYDFIMLCNDEMTKTVKGQLLTTEGSSPRGMGSRALGEIHQVTEDQYDHFRARGLAASVNKYLVKYLVDYNFANVDGYPRFTFDDDEEEDLVSASKVVLQLKQAFPEYDMDMEQIQEKFGYTFTKKLTAGNDTDTEKPATPQPNSEGVEQ